jgi:hypothetical protein
MPLQMQSAITTDGAPSMMGSITGFIVLWKKNQSLLNFMSCHCIIHQEALRVKVLQFGYITKVSITIINCIREAPWQRWLSRPYWKMLMTKI